MTRALLSHPRRATGVAAVLAMLLAGIAAFDLRTAMVALTSAGACALGLLLVSSRAAAARRAAINGAVERLAVAAEGDLSSTVPAVTTAHAPELASAMAALFEAQTIALNTVSHLALVDAVTGLPNRTSFRRSCERVLAELPDTKNAALLFIDLDRFKLVNDTMGHATGDLLLEMVANRLRAVGERFAGACDGHSPLIGRLAGDEFTMFFVGVSDPVTVGRICRSVLFALSEPFRLHGSDVTIGASVGIALRPDHGRSLTELMRAADAAMYHAKASGRGRAEHFSETLAAGIAQRHQLESELRDAIRDDQFMLVFQPQVAAGDGAIVAAEALVRWRHPRDGFRLPGSFIQRAEETGLIVEIGEWVVREVAATIARWERIGVEHRLAINVSPRQIDHVAFFEQLRAAMLAANAPARLLELEISEALAMRCSESVIDAIRQLRADGATIAIDDYGTAASNLPRLRRLPIDRIKLDRSLIEHVVEDAQARAVAQAVIGLAHGLGCEAVGEGIESRAQADVLRVIGCDVIQGYAIAEPMAEEAFIAWARGIAPLRRDTRASA
ncbi:EAL domain-containing protein [Sphingomonas sp. H39-1-10]|uniref:putative bifunctional diguanylate cyclase/phosphodiesterase n=1 Tax=Sphingomonas TaxID=13687 RepID=UPI0008881159|nr:MULTISPECIES: EAL domain-containing protein [Sphingomonas]MDF0488811.1 EAL domain-containing protein [Sphingomonas pollutisoli]SDA13781.1 diguanylate cyclase (GGDEF) domain-containing protein [Sphingomonas sp. NFR15]